MVTKQEAEMFKMFEHVKRIGSDMKPIRCRATGACQTWKTRPEDFKLPVKYGLYQSFYITPHNAGDWSPVK